MTKTKRGAMTSVPSRAGGVTAEDDRRIRCRQTVGQTGKLRLYVDNLGDIHRPLRRFDAAGFCHFGDLRLRALSWHNATTCFVDVVTTRVFGASAEIGTESSVLGKESVRHLA